MTRRPPTTSRRTMTSQEVGPRGDAFALRDRARGTSRYGRVMSSRGPTATTPGRSRNMAAIPRRDTKPERELRSALHAAGLRFRVDHPIRVAGLRPIRPDVVFTRTRVAVFVDGCFWHGCPEHGQRPQIKNEHYWNPKISGNQERDRRHVEALEGAGWRVLRFWAHEPPERICTTVVEAVRASDARPSSTGRSASR